METGNIRKKSFPICREICTRILLLAENTEKYVEKYLFNNNVCRRSPGGFTELVQLVIFVEIDIYGKLSSAGEQNHSQNRSEQKRKSHLLPFSMKMLHPVNKVTRSCPSLEFSAITNIHSRRKHQNLM